MGTQVLGTRSHDHRDAMMARTSGTIYMSIFFQHRHNFEGLLNKWKSADNYLAQGSPTPGPWTGTGRGMPETGPQKQMKPHLQEAHETTSPSLCRKKSLSVELVLKRLGGF
uniref:Uncharacterized protein n=1 Tax=Micrurus corallinus TaxID=54390 RepID=A0A2D4GU38_MICCO